MEFEILGRLQEFNLLDEEESGLILEATDIQVSKEECLRSLFGKIYGAKTTNYTGLRNTMTALWKGIGPFKRGEQIPIRFLKSRR